MGGREKDLVRGTYLAKSALVEHGDTVGQGAYHCEVMRDKYIGRSPIGLELPQQVQDHGLDRYIECGCHLVAKDKFRIGSEGPRHRDTLFFPPGQLPGQAIEIIGAQTDPLEQRYAALSQFVATQTEIEL